MKIYVNIIACMRRNWNKGKNKNLLIINDNTMYIFILRTYSILQGTQGASQITMNIKSYIYIYICISALIA